MTTLLTHAAALEAALAEVVGAPLTPVTLTFDYGVPADGSTLRTTAAVDRATRTLAFAHAEARRADGQVVLSASAVFRVPAPAT